MASFRFFPNQRWFISVWRRDRRGHFNLPDGEVMITEWIMDTLKTLVETALAMTTARGFSLQQSALMALSVIALDTHRGDPRRDHAPARRSNHQRLRRRLQHSGGHGGGGALACNTTKTLTDRTDDRGSDSSM